MALVVLSLVPSRLQLSGNARCGVAFLIAAAITRSAFRDFETRWQITGFAIAAAVFWACRICVARRNMPGTRWLASAAESFVGAVVVRVVAHRHLWRHL